MLILSFILFANITPSEESINVVIPIIKHGSMTLLTINGRVKPTANASIDVPIDKGIIVLKLSRLFCFSMLSLNILMPIKKSIINPIK